jgi:hypothetical protein
MLDLSFTCASLRDVEPGNLVYVKRGGTPRAAIVVDCSGVPHLPKKALLHLGPWQEPYVVPMLALDPIPDESAVVLGTGFYFDVEPKPGAFSFGRLMQRAGDLQFDDGEVALMTRRTDYSDGMGRITFTLSGAKWADPQIQAPGRGVTFDKWTLRLAPGWPGDKGSVVCSWAAKDRGAE